MSWQAQAAMNTPTPPKALHESEVDILLTVNDGQPVATVRVHGHGNMTIPQAIEHVKRVMRAIRAAERALDVTPSKVQP